MLILKQPKSSSCEKNITLSFQCSLIYSDSVANFNI